MARPFDVYVLGDMTSDIERRILRGAMRYAADRPARWRVAWGGPPALPFERLARGVLAGVTNREIERRLSRLRLPVANFSSRLVRVRQPSVVPDNAAIGRLAAEYFFRERRYSRFAFVGIAAHHYSREREAAFREALAGAPMPTAEAVGADGADALVRWLRELPRGTAVFTANDYVARQVVRHAKDAGRAVPDDLAVLGVDAEELVSLSADVSISSVDPGFERIGYEAARLLDRLMSGKPPPTAPLRIAPAGVIERDSTGAYGAEDSRVRDALHLIHERSCEGLRAADVARAVGMSRRALEMRFRAAGAGGIHAAIRAARLSRARELLDHSDLRISEIADRCGFRDIFYFSSAFKRGTGVSPLVYRRNRRLR